MKNKSFYLSLYLLIIYTLFLSVYVLKFSESGVFESSIQELESLIGQTSLSIEVFLIIVSIIFSIISLLTEYFLSKFLVLLFVEEGIVSLVDVVIAKLTVLTINFLILLLIPSLSSLFQPIINILGIFMMVGLSITRQGNKITALLFCLPFLLDILISLLT